MGRGELFPSGGLAGRQKTVSSSGGKWFRRDPHRATKEGLWENCAGLWGYVAASACEYERCVLATLWISRIIVANGSASCMGMRHFGDQWRRTHELFADLPAACQGQQPHMAKSIAVGRSAPAIHARVDGGLGLRVPYCSNRVHAVSSA